MNHSDKLEFLFQNISILNGAGIKTVKLLKKKRN